MGDAVTGDVVIKFVSSRIPWSFAWLKMRTLLNRPHLSSSFSDQGTAVEGFTRGLPADKVPEPWSHKDQ
jgi:hypothetical protein